MNVLPPQKLKCDQARQAGSLPRCLLGRQLLSWWFYPDAKSGFWICRLSLKLVCQLISGATSLRQLLINPAEKDQKVNLLIYYINYKYHAVAAAAKSLQSCPTLWDPIDGSPPGSPVPGILQARTLEWVAISSSRRASRPRDWTHVSCVSVALASGFFTTEPSGKPKSGDSEEHKLWERKEITPAKGRGPELHQHTLDFTEDVT